MKRDEGSWLLRALGMALAAVLLASTAAPVLAGADPIVGGDEPGIEVDAGGDLDEEPLCLQGLIDEAIEKGIDEVTLSGDVVEGVTVPKDAVLTLDLGGHVLTGKDGAAIINEGTLTIKNGTVVGGGEAAALVCGPQSRTQIEKSVTLAAVEAEGLCDVTVDDLRVISEHQLVETAAKDATCTEPGVRAHMACATCGKLFLDGKELTADELAIPATGHTELEAVAEVPSTCTEPGVKAHVACVACGALFSDAEGTAPVTADELALELAAHTLAKTEAKDATCTEDGTIACWTCTVCGKAFSDEQGTTEATDAVIKATGHKGTLTPAVQASCTEDGNTAYWTCETCGKLFSDEAMTQETTLEKTVVAATGHTLAKTDEKPATCTEDGTIAYWTCTACKKVFSDEKGTTEATDFTIKASGHKLDHVAAKEATEEETGLLEHWKCGVCGALFADEAAATPTTAEAVTTPVKEPEPRVFTVTFVWGGSIETMSVEVKEGTKVAAPTKVPALEGYTFTGTWYLTRAQGGAVSGAYDFATPVTGDLTLYAGWLRDAKDDPKAEDKTAKNPAIPNAGEEASAAALVLVAGAAVAAAGIALRKRSEK